MKKLWNDLETDEERIEFLESGRAEETGIISEAMVPEIVSLFKDKIEQSQERVSVDAVVTGMSDEELMELTDEVSKWCYLTHDDKPFISLNGIIKAIELLEEKYQ